MAGWLRAGLYLPYISLLSPHISQDLMAWLVGSEPGGFKLNDKLNEALGSAVLRVLWPWHAMLRAALVYLDSSLGGGALRLLLLAPCSVGLSGALCVVSDLLGLCSLHILYLHRAARALYAAHLAMLLTMSNLFRGRKYNLLRTLTVALTPT